MSSIVNLYGQYTAEGHGHGILELCVTEMYPPRHFMQIGWLQYAVVRHCSVSKQTEHSASSNVGRFRFGLIVFFFDLDPLRKGLRSLAREVDIVVSMRGVIQDIYFGHVIRGGRVAVVVVLDLVPGPEWNGGWDEAVHGAIQRRREIAIAREASTQSLNHLRMSLCNSKLSSFSQNILANAIHLSNSLRWSGFSLERHFCWELSTTLAYYVVPFLQLWKLIYT